MMKRKPSKKKHGKGTLFNIGTILMYDSEQSESVNTFYPYLDSW